jgi:NAD(P)-dependent dehydrogenase (short-subunit alcohol dehydrogenase family)
MPSNVLVTGSNSGFGRLTSVALAKRGHTVFATMREPEGKNAAAAKELAQVATVLPLDVTSDRSVDAAVAAALRQVGHLDAVINNAGYAVLGLNETITAAQYLAELDTNVVGQHRVNRAVLPSMRERKAGLIVHVSSGLGRILMPFVGLYASTKWAVEALAETYRMDTKGLGIDISIVQPGAFPTAFNQQALYGGDADRGKGYGPMADGAQMMNRFMEQLFAMPNGPDPQEVADAIVKLVETPAGQRPLRISVDRFNGQSAVALNTAHADVQRALLAGIGMPFLAE